VLTFNHARYYDVVADLTFPTSFLPLSIADARQLVRTLHLHLHLHVLL
jgi:hypothetical protein